jgi:nicotinamide mononucleotide transporter
MITDWIAVNYIEIFGALAGILYVLLEIRQNVWLWPVGILTSAAYIWIFFTGKLYADMGLQVYYLVISIAGWYWWLQKEEGLSVQEDQGRMTVKEARLHVTRLRLKTGIILSIVFIILYSAMALVLMRFTDSPVPGWDSFITSLSVIATWMLARKIFEHWYLWVLINFTAAILFFTRGLYPTVILYMIYCIMSFAGIREWRRSLAEHVKP